MAYDTLNRYTDELAREYEKTGDISYLFSLTSFYSIVLEPSNRFRSQKHYAVETIKRINPAFAEGYFKKSKSKRT